MRRRIVCSDDSGATLIIALILVTTVALVVGATLSLAGTSVNTTVALRDQGATAYAADGAAQTAVSALRTGKYPGNCAAATGTAMALGSAAAPFYPAPQSPTGALNAVVRCTPDTGTSSGVTIGGSNKPADALLTVGTSTQEAGQDFGQGAANKTVSIANGNVSSNSTITTGKDTLAVSGSGVAVQAATSCDGKYSPTQCTSPHSIRPTPSLPLPTDPVSKAPGPVCSGNYAAFRPGLYSNLSTLNGTCGQKKIVWFSPGTYYFDFDGQWNIPSTLVGGTPMNSADPSEPISGLDPVSAASLSLLSDLHSMPGACADPRLRIAPGVEFVFGASAQMNVGANAMELCATYDATWPPTAIYGVPAGTAEFSNGGAGSMSPQAGCIVAISSGTGKGKDKGNDSGCSLIETAVNGHAEIHVNGYVYAPSSRIELTLKNSPGQVFNWGLVLRSFAIAVNGSSPTAPFIQLPADSASGATVYSIMYLSVWTCAASSSACSAHGAPHLTAKVQVAEADAGGTAVRVLSWSQER